MHVGIAGAGLLGRLLAWQLARSGHRVTVFDPAASATERRAAAWTAAGMLSPHAELECADASIAALGWRSLDCWAQIAAQLPGEAGFRRAGSLLLAHAGDRGAAARLLALMVAKAPRHPAPVELSSPELTAMEPSLHRIAHAWLLEGEGQIDTVAAMQALTEGASQAGADWRWSAPVAAVHAEHIDGARFDHVFDVRGLGARGPATDATAGWSAQLRGVRGEIIWLHAPGVGLARPLRLLHPRWRVYLVPRAGDIVLVGASEIESEDRSPISVRTLLELLSAAHSVVPALAEARVVHTETNLRPALPDNLPRVESLPGLTRINGLFRHGWMIAPALVEQALQASGLRSGASLPARACEEAM
jgi:glycine oxidase